MMPEIQFIQGFDLSGVGCLFLYQASVCKLIHCGEVLMLEGKIAETKGLEDLLGGLGTVEWGFSN